jgi:TorA maturation chaperone TorD
LDGIETRRPLAASQRALARSRAYTLFGSLYLNGLTGQTLSQVQVIPELVETLPEFFDANEAAADHQHLFGFNVFPYQSIFLDPSGLLGGDITERVIQSYQEAGFDVKAGSESADHIGHELNLLAFLSRQEANARQEGPSEILQRTINLQRDFLDKHLLPWLPALVQALGRQESPFYATLADLTLDLVAEHQFSLKPDPRIDFQLPAPPGLLEDEGTGLKEIVDYLLRPAYGGIYLSRDDIGRLARQRSLPRGFGDRRQMLLNLLRSAANYGGLVAILGELHSMASSWAAAYAEMAHEPILAPFANPWHSRASKTTNILDDMGRHLDSQS